MNLLVLDADPIFTAALQSTLVNIWPGRILVTRTCAEAFKVLLGPQYVPLLIMDLELPDGDSFSMVQRARERGCMSSTQSAVLTASPYRESVLRAKQLGMAHYIVKPFQIENGKQILLKSLNELQGEPAFLMQLLSFLRKVESSQLTESAVSQFYHLSLLSKVPSVSNALARMRSYLGHQRINLDEVDSALNALRLHCEFLIGKNKMMTPNRAESLAWPASGS